jgi:TolB protein
MDTTCKRISLFTALFLIIMVKITAQMPGSGIGSFDVFSDIGTCAISGSASFSEPQQIYRITGSGSNIWYAEDHFAFLNKKMEGDFILQTQIKFIGEGHEPHRKTGIMFRSSKSISSPMVSCTVHGDGLTSLQYRKTEGANVEEIKLVISSPDVLMLERKCNSYIMSVARFGEVYQIEKIENIDLGNSVLAGIFVCSHNNAYSEEVEFSNTRIFKPAFQGLVQYKDYLASCLEVVDVETGHRRVVASKNGGLEAPNWSPDGKTLMVNSMGLLYNFNFNTRETTLINTDFAVKNNNDHVLSFDGKMVGISHHATETNGQSLIYTLPAEGGVPKKITEKSPSYLHGWSPDNKFLIYTAERNGDYDIYKISVDGGNEIQLTNTKGLDDGSEYSYDGKFIYFCSTRTGTMQIWRMDADGKNQVQLTFGELNNWFPHISPDNKWIVFISYPKEVAADKHPYYERVYIRMIPVEGGEPKVISYLYGGQGSLNVPSWSPDSKKIAFVSNGNFE